MKKVQQPVYPHIERVDVEKLTIAEKDKLLSAILYHLGRGVERTVWPGEPDGSINLVMLRDDW